MFGLLHCPVTYCGQMHVAHNGLWYQHETCHCYSLVLGKVQPDEELCTDEDQ